MRTAKLIRNETSDEGTFGTLTTDTGWVCHTGELPWKDNKQSISCIPVGIYIVKFSPSAKFGHAYQLQNVPNRNMVEMHRGNWCGDKSLGLRSDVEGCILLGSVRGLLSNQQALISSAFAVSEFQIKMAESDFQLTIEEAY